LARCALAKAIFQETCWGEQPAAGVYRLLAQAPIFSTIGNAMTWRGTASGKPLGFAEDAPGQPSR